jgi:hypothetical protein
LIGLDLEYASGMNCRIKEWIDECNKIRCATKTMKGSLQGKIKVLGCIQIASDKLFIKSSKEDPVFWRNRCVAVETENSDLKQKIHELELRINKLETNSNNNNNKDNDNNNTRKHSSDKIYDTCTDI